jgi:poly-beta-hydroxybutyrate-responsive repressor
MAELPSTLPRNFLRPALLLLLKESPAHGYDLVERLRALGFPAADPGGVYRALRGLESEGLVDSAWETSPQGPDRRIYGITRGGAEHLHEAALQLRDTAELLEQFLSRYSEFVALPRTSSSESRAAGWARP